MPKIFLTGASGNVGRPVLSELLKHGYVVTALAHRNSNIEGCRVVYGKLSAVDKHASEISLCDAVIHLASAKSVDRNPVLKEDILGTGLLLDNWRKGNFVYMSSQTVYGIPHGVLTEDHPLVPQCWYDIAKICCESQLSIEPARFGRGVGIAFRMALFFGPSGNGQGDQFLDNIYAHCAKGHIFSFESEEGMETAGSSFVGPQDLARAVVGSLQLKTAGVYNISSGFCTWRSLIEAMCKKCGLKPKFSLFSKLPPAAHYVRMPQSRSCVDASKFQGLATFVPNQGLEELVNDFVRSLP